MSSESLKTAQQLIKQKRYDEARAVLLNSDHPLAKAWLDSIDGLVTSGQPRLRWWWIVGVVVIVALAAGVLYGITTYQQNQLAEQARQMLALSNSGSDLPAICSQRGYTQQQCQDWMVQQVIDQEAAKSQPPKLPGITK